MKFNKKDVVVPNDLDYTVFDLGIMGLSPLTTYEVLDAFEDQASAAGSGYSVEVRNDRGQKWIYDEQTFLLSTQKS